MTTHIHCTSRFSYFERCHSLRQGGAALILFCVIFLLPSRSIGQEIDSLDLDNLREEILEEMQETLIPTINADSLSLQTIRAEILEPLMRNEHAKFLDRVRFPFYYGTETLTRSTLETRISEIFTPAFCEELNDFTGYKSVQESEEFVKRCKKGRPGSTCLVRFKKSKGVWVIQAIDIF